MREGRWAADGRIVICGKKKKKKGEMAKTKGWVGEGHRCF